MPNEKMRQDGYQRWVSNRILTVAVGFALLGLGMYLLSSKVPQEGAAILLGFMMWSVGGLGVLGAGLFAVAALFYRLGMLVKKRPNEKVRLAVWYGVMILWGVEMIYILGFHPRLNISLITSAYILGAVMSVILLGIAALVFMAGMNSNFSREDYERMLAEYAELRRKKFMGSDEKGGDEN